MTMAIQKNISQCLFYRECRLREPLFKLNLEYSVNKSTSPFLLMYTDLSYYPGKFFVVLFNKMSRVNWSYVLSGGFY